MKTADDPQLEDCQQLKARFLKVQEDQLMHDLANFWFPLEFFLSIIIK